jgi:hypothetical protein
LLTILAIPNPFADNNATEEIATIGRVPADDNQPRCNICKEKFKSVWDYDAEEWVFEEATSLQGYYLHEKCASTLDTPEKQEAWVEKRKRITDLNTSLEIEEAPPLLEDQDDDSNQTPKKQKIELQHVESEPTLVAPQLQSDQPSIDMSDNNEKNEQSENK